MKTLQCDLCEATAQGETFEQWMENMMPHYKEAHGDMMKSMSELPEEEQQAKKAEWMKEMGAKFDAA